jgi:hypothetical protein
VVDVAPGENDAQLQWAAVGPWRNLHRRERTGEIMRFDFFDAFVMRGLQLGQGALPFIFKLLEDFVCRTRASSSRQNLRLRLSSKQPL